MVQGTLLPNSTEVKLVSLRSKAGAIEMHLRACRRDAVCPSCNRSSSRVHSRYVSSSGRSTLGGLGGAKRDLNNMEQTERDSI